MNAAVRLGLDIGALHPSDSKSRHLLVFNFRLYLDDSGSQTTGPVYAIGGYLAPEKQWKQLARSWQRALDEAGIELFHAKQFFRFSGRSGRAKSTSASHVASQPSPRNTPQWAWLVG